MHDINVEIFLENLKSFLDEKIKNLIPNNLPLPKNEQSFFRKIISSCLKELIQDKDEFERLHNLKIQDRYDIVNSHIAKSIKKTVQVGTVCYSYSNNELYSTPENKKYFYYLVIKNKELVKYFSLKKMKTLFLIA